MNRFEKYFTLHKKYSEKYGEKAIVLLPIGKFYEMYEGNTGPDLGLISNILGLKKCKMCNHNLLGFPIQLAIKYIKIMIDADYTVIIIDNDVEIYRRYNYNNYDDTEDIYEEEIMTITI